MKMVFYWYKDIQVDLWNRIESSIRPLHGWPTDFFDKGTKKVQWRKESLLYFNYIERQIVFKIKNVRNNDRTQIIEREMFFNTYGQHMVVS